MQQKKDADGGLRGAAAEAERELRRLVDSINDHVVPEVRTRTAGALHLLAGELRRLADRLAEPSPADAARDRSEQSSRPQPE